MSRSFECQTSVIALVVLSNHRAEFPEDTLLTLLCPWSAAFQIPQFLLSIVVRRVLFQGLLVVLDGQLLLPGLHVGLAQAVV